MKKLIMSFATILLLAGCGGNDGTESKTCKMDDKFEVKFDAKEDKLTDAVIKWKMDALEMNKGGLDGSKMTTKEKEDMDKKILQILGKKEGDGVESNIDYNGDNIVITLTFKFPDSSPIILERLNFDGGPNMSLSKIVEDAKKGGVSCD